MANKSNKRNKISEQARNRGLRLPGTDKTQDATNELLTTISGNVSELIEYFKKQEQEEDVDKKKGVVKNAVKGSSSSSSASKNDMSTMLNNIQTGLYFIVSNFANKVIKPGDTIQSFVKAKGSQKSIADFISTIYYDNHDNYKNILDALDNKKEKGSSVSGGDVDDIKDYVDDIRDYSHDIKDDINTIGQLTIDKLQAILDEMQNAPMNVPDPNTKPMQSPNDLSDIVKTIQQDVSGIILNRLTTIADTISKLKISSPGENNKQQGTQSIDNLSNIISDIQDKLGEKGVLSSKLQSILDEIIGFKKNASSSSKQDVKNTITHNIQFKDDATYKIFENLNSLLKEKPDTTAIENALENVITKLVDVIKKADKNGKDFKRLESLVGENGFLAQVCKNINNLNTNVKNTKSPAEGISTIINSVISLGEFDKAKYKNTKKFLRKLIVLTSKPNAIGKLKDDGNGLLYKLVNNVNDLSEELKNINPNKSMDDVNKFLRSVLDIGNLENAEEEVENFKDALKSIGSLYKKGGALPKLAKQINSYFGDRENKNMLKRSVAITSDISKIFDSITETANKIKVKKIFALNVSIIALGGAFWLINKLSKYSEKVDRKKLSKLKKVTDSLSSVFASLGDVYDNVSLKGIMKLNIGIMMLASTIMIVNPVASLAQKITKGGTKSSKIATIGTFAKLLDRSFIKVNDVVEHTPNAKDLLKVTFILGGIGGLALMSLVAGMLSKSASNKISNINTFLVGMRDDVLKVLGKMSNTKYITGAIESLKSIWTVTKSLTKIALMSILGGMLSKLANKLVPAMSTYVGSIGDLLKDINSAVNVTKAKAAIHKLKLVRSVVTNIGIIGLYSTLFMPFVLTGMIGLKIMGLMVTSINSFVLKINKIKVDIKKNLEKLKDVRNVVLNLGLISLFATIFMPFVLTGMLGLKIMGLMVTSINSFIAKIDNIKVDNIKENVSKLKSIRKIILSIGLIGLMATLFMPFALTGWLGLKLMGLMISAIKSFIKSLSKIKVNKHALKKLNSVTKVILKASAILLLGAIVGTLVLAALPAIIGFTVVLGLFLTGMALVLGLLTLVIGKKRLHSMEQFSILIAASGAVLCLGAMFMMIPGLWIQALKFGVVLAAFVTLISLPYILMTAFGGKRAIKSAAELNKLVVTSAAVMLIGGLFMFIPGLPMNVLKFALMLGGFVIAICFAFRIAAKAMKWKAIAAMLMLTALVVISGTLLLTAGMMMIKYPGLEDGIWTFLKMDAAMILGMAAVVGVIAALIKSKVLDAKSLGGAFAVMLGILGLIWLTGKAMNSIIESMQKVGGKWEDMDKYCKLIKKVLGGFMIAVAAVAAIIGVGAAVGAAVGGGTAGAAAGAASVVAVFAAAEALIAGIIKIVGMTGEAMSLIAQGMKDWKSVGKFNFSHVKKSLGGYLELVGILTGAFGSTGLIGTAILTAALANINIAANCVSKIANSIKDVSELSIPIYGEGGKVVGRRNLTKEDFKLAADNISCIITTIGGAIIDLYKKDDKGIFGNWKTSFFHQDTPFTRVCKSCTNLGAMIALISEGVKDMADLKIGVYKGTKLVGYRRLTDEDFDMAAINISKICTTLGGTIMAIYDAHPDMFNDKSLLSYVIGESAGNTKFGLVIKTCTGLSKLISEMSTAVKDVIDLKIPIYEGTEVKGYHHLNAMDFAMVGINVSMIMTSIAQALFDVYDKHPDMFQDKSLWAEKTGWQSAGNTKMSRVISSFNNVGFIVSQMAMGLQSVINLDMPEYDENGHKTDKRIKINIDELKKGGKLFSNIETIMCAMPEVLAEVFKKGEPLGWWDDTEGGFKGALDWCMGNDNMFATVGKVTKIVSDIVIQQSGAIDKIVNIKAINAGLLKDRVKRAMQVLPEALYEVYKTGDKNDWWDEDPYEDMKGPLEIINQVVIAQKDAVEKVVKTLNDSMKDVDFGDLKGKINQMMQFLPNAIHDLLYESDNSTEMKASYKAIMSDQTIVTSISTAYSSYGQAIESMISSFKNVNDLMQNLNKGKKEDTATLFDTVVENMKKLLCTMSSVNMSEQTIRLLTGSFTTCAASYAEGINRLKGAFTDFPVLDEGVTTGIKNAFSTINYSIEGVDESSLDKFQSETTSLSDFVQAVNEVDIQKASSITRMMNSIKDMATKIGDLNAFTKTLAEDLSVVLEHLTQQLKESAKTIDTAERIQKERHKQIQKSIQTVNTLLNNPVNVIVKQEDIQSTQIGPDNSGSGFNDSSASFSGGTGSNGSQFNGGSQQSGPDEEQSQKSLLNKFLGNTVKGVEKALGISGGTSKPGSNSNGRQK